MRAETDRRAVAAVMKAERALGRVPEQQHHSNPGYDVLSTDPATNTCYFIEVKGHLPQTEQISVSKRQVGQAKCSPERWRLAVVSVPEDPDTEPEVRYLIDLVPECDAAPRANQRAAQCRRTARLRRPATMTHRGDSLAAQERLRSRSRHPIVRSSKMSRIA